MKVISDEDITQIVRTLREAAIVDADLPSARNLLGHYLQHRQEYVDVPHLATTPAEHRHEAIFQAVSRGTLSIAQGERMCAMVSRQISAANTIVFLRFLREIASGSDPILTARRLALELEPPELPETLEAH